MSLQLQTPRLFVREIKKDDVAAMHLIYGDPEVMKFIPSGPSLDLDHTRRRAENLIKHQQQSGFSQWGVIEKTSNTLIGICGLILVEGKGPDIELAYELRRDRWNRGYITEAASACLVFGFQSLGMKHIIAMAFPENIASWRVMEKCGMKKVGLQTFYSHELLVYEKFADDRL